MGLTSEEKLELSRRLLEQSPDLRHVDIAAAIRYGRDDYAKLFRGIR